MEDVKNYPTVPDEHGYYFESQKDEEKGIRKRIYPTPVDEDGYSFENEDDDEMGIQTKKYANGSATKKVTLSSGSVAIIRKLRGRDFVDTKKRLQDDKSLDFETTNMAVATKIDDKIQPPEYYLDDLFQEDYSLLMGAYSKLNF